MDTSIAFDNTLHEIISQRASQTPQKNAVVFNDSSISYQKLDLDSNSLSNSLISSGIKPGDIVGIYLERDIELLVVQLAVLKAGAAFALLDRQYPSEMLARLLENFDIPIVLTKTEFSAVFSKVARTQILSLDELGDCSNENPPNIKVDPDATCFVLFTSGSTGIPKGVIHSHRNILSRIHAASNSFETKIEDVFAQISPLSSVDAIDEIFHPLTFGASVSIVPYSIVVDPIRLIEVLEGTGVTKMILVPSLLSVILRMIKKDERRLINLKVWVIGGEALSPILAKSFYEKFPTSKLKNFYGLTEGDATTCEISSLDEQITVGYPIVNTKVYVLDDKLGLLPPGIQGDIYLAGSGLFKGYWNRPDLDAERFFINPYSNERIFKTGDIGYFLPDGRLVYVGRSDRSVKVRGFRVELGEVEAAIGNFSNVQECAVKAWVTDDNTNTDLPNQTIIAAYVVFKESNESAMLELREYLKKHLPDYALPKGIIEVPGIQLLPNGKVDYSKLPKLNLEDVRPSSNYTAPRDEIESYLVNLWEKVLNRKQIGINDNFFDVGGDSLLVIILIAELEKTFRRTLSLALLFHAPTISQLASALRETGLNSETASLVPIRTEGSKQGLFCVHADGGAFFYTRLTSYMSPEQTLYGIQARGLDGNAPPFTNIKDMAEQYIKEIRMLQPDGPLILSGFSMGGVVVYEMAQQLLREEKEPHLFIFIDAPSPDYPEMMENYDSGIKRKLRRFIDLPLSHKMKYIINGLSNYWQKYRDDLLCKVYQRMGWKLAPHLRIHMVRKINQAMGDSYKPEPYPGDIVILRASEQMAGAKPDRTLGWGKYVTGNIYDHEIYGDHDSIFQEPNVKALAEKIQVCIDFWLDRKSTSH